MCCKVDFASLLAVEGNFLGCFEGNFENTRRMEMFSMPVEGDLVVSFMFGQGRIQCHREHVYLILLFGMNDLRR